MMMREELIPTVNVEDCVPARNFMGLLCSKEQQRKTYSNMSRL